MLETLTPNSLVIGPRPGKKSFDRLAGLGLTHCCTLLGEKEDPQLIEKICRRLNCEWVWLPVDGGGLDTLAATPMAAHLDTLQAALVGVEQPRVYLHCSAGLHRTGYVAYILLRVMGLDAPGAMTALRDLRPITAEEVGAERIALAEGFARSYLAG